MRLCASAFHHPYSTPTLSAPPITSTPFQPLPRTPTPIRTRAGLCTYTSAEYCSSPAPPLAPPHWFFTYHSETLAKVLDL